MNDADSPTPSASDQVVCLVAEDPETRDSLTAIVRSIGLTVESFDSVPSFLTRRMLGHPGCVLLDVHPACGNILELLEQTKRPDLPVIIIGDIDMPTAVRAMRAGAFDILPKPVDPHALLRDIHEAKATAAKQRALLAAQAEIDARWAKLSLREQEVAHLLVDGKTTKEIASALSISPKTVDNHRTKLLEKMRAENPIVLRKMLFPGDEPVYRPQ